MKRLTLFFALLALGAASKAQFVKAELEVSGLTCSMCSLSTEKALNTLDFIGSIKPDLNNNIFYITFKPGMAVNMDAIKQKVKGAGFSVSKLVAVFNFNHLQVSNGFDYNYADADYHFTVAGTTLLNGETRLTIIDKDFIPPASFKKFGAQVKDPAYTTGLNEKKQRVYHVTLS